MGDDENGNLKPELLPELNWDDASRAKSLEEIKKWSSGQAQAVHQWYMSNKGAKHLCARLSRSVAIVLGAVAGVLPVISQIYGTTQHPILLNPLWSTVLAAAVATLIALDRFMGWSTAWSRFITAATDVHSAISDFEFDWQQERRLWANGTPDPDQTQRAVVLARAFVVKVNQVVREETAAWVAEFQTVVRQLDDLAKVKVEALSAAPSVNVTITNGDQVDAPGWKLTADSGHALDRTGKSGALAGLPSGNRVFTVTGTIKGKPVHAEKAANVVPGAPVLVELTLA